MDPDAALALQGTQVIRGGVLGLEPHQLGNLGTGRRHAGLPKMGANAVEYFLLAVG